MSIIGNLTLTIVEARKLTNKDGLFGKNDAYAIIKVGKKKEKTNILANAGANPKWDQTFHFELHKDDEISLEVWDYDKLKDDIIGSVKIPHTTVFIQGTVENWYAIGQGSKNSGEVFLKHHFQPAGTYQQGANVPGN